MRQSHSPFVKTRPVKRKDTLALLRMGGKQVGAPFAFLVSQVLLAFEVGDECLVNFRD
jgi:hypothetical protein